VVNSANAGRVLGPLQLAENLALQILLALDIPVRSNTRLEERPKTTGWLESSHAAADRECPVRLNGYYIFP
jgi:hypothetical protein